jgi:bile acid:Na+ symporter, BASS family
VTDETLLVIVLAVLSTLSAGLAVGGGSDGPVDPGARRRMAVIIGANVVALPVFAFAISALVQDRDATLGLVVVAAAPGGPTGPLLAGLAGGEPRLAARLFLVLTLIGTVASVLAVALLDPASLPRLGAALSVVVVSAVVPLLAGRELARRWPTPAARLGVWCSRASAAALVATIALLASRHGHAAVARDLGVAVIVVAASLAIGLLGRSRADAIAIAQVSAVRNVTLACWCSRSCAARRPR